MDIKLWLEFGAIAVTGIGIIISRVRAETKLKAEVAEMRETVKKLDLETSKALEKINDRIDEARKRSDEREDMLRDKMDTITSSLGTLHLEVLKAIKEN